MAWWVAQRRKTLAVAFLQSFPLETSVVLGALQELANTSDLRSGETTR